MAINFQSLPQDNPFSIPKPGVYKAKIVEATMRKPQSDATKPEYLNLKLDLYSKDNKKVGSIYDIISESDSSVVQYKIARFVRACGFQLQGSMELKDLAKIVLNKLIAVDVTEDKKATSPRAVVDVFSREAYYMYDEFETIYSMLNPSESSNDFAPGFEPVTTDETEIPFNTGDGLGNNSGSPQY